MEILELLFRANTEQLEHAEKTVEELKDKVKDLAGEIPGLGETFSKLAGDVAKAGEMIAGFESGLLGVAAGATVAGVALGAVAIAMAFKYNEKIQELNDLGEKYGYSASQIDLMNIAAQGAGSTLSQVEQIYNKVAASAYKANDPLKGTGVAFNTLGIELKGSNGELKSAAELTAEAVEAWKNGDQTTADLAAAQKILGRNFLENLPALEAVAEAQRRVTEFEKAGIGISEAGAKAAEESKHANQDLTFVMDSMGSKLVGQIIPYFTKLSEEFVDSYKEGGTVKDIFVAMQYAGEGLMVILEGLVTIGKLVIKVFVDLGVSVVDSLRALWALMHGDSEGAKNIMGELGHRWAEDMASSWKDITDTAHRGFALINGDFENSRKQLDKIGEQKKGHFDNGGGDAAPVKDKTQDAINNLIESLAKLTETESHYNEIQKVDHLLKLDKYKDATDYNRALAQGFALMADGLKTQNILDDETKRLTQSTDTYTRAIADQMQPLKLTKDELALQAAQVKVNTEYETTLANLKKAGLATDSAIQDALDKKNAALAKNNAEYEKLKAYEGNWINAGAKEYVSSLGTVDTALSTLVNNGLKGFEGQLDSLVTTGKVNFKSFVASLLDDIAKMIIQFTIMIPLANQLKQSLGGTGSGGSGWTGAVSTFLSGYAGAHADGGPTQPGQTYLVGEKGPELWTAPGAGQMLPNGSFGGSSTGGAANNMHFTHNITVQSTNGNVKDSIEQGRQIQAMVDKQIRATIANESRPGGSLSSAQRRY